MKAGIYITDRTGGPSVENALISGNQTVIKTEDLDTQPIMLKELVTETGICSLEIGGSGDEMDGFYLGSDWDTLDWWSKEVKTVIIWIYPRTDHPYVRLYAAPADDMGEFSDGYWDLSTNHDYYLVLSKHESGHIIQEIYESKEIHE